MIPVSEAIEIIHRELGSGKSEKVDLELSVGRVLAENIFADMDLPPFDRSQMDGFAVKAEDAKNVPVELKIIGESAAGKGFDGKVKSREAVRIMTGARVPKGSDAVQKIELTSESDNIVRILETTEKGRFIVPKGSEIKKGTRIFPKGEIVTANQVASLAAFGYSCVNVSQLPRVTILATGSEIVAINKTPKKDQIRNSNSAMLKTLAEKCGALAETLPVTKDEISNLKSQIAKSVKGTEIVIITGGVSVGKYDFTKTALQELGAEIFFEKVRLKPGKPTVFARLGKTLIFGLPGNPVSAAVTFYLFVRRALLAMQGAKDIDLKSGFAVLTKPAEAAKTRDTYWPATLDSDKKGRLLATPLLWGGSSDFVAFSHAEALIKISKDRTITAGEVAPILYLPFAVSAART